MYDILVNKTNRLDKNYIPNDLVKLERKYSTKECFLRKKANKAFTKLCKSAHKNNLNIKAISCFRSFEYQKNLYINYIKEMGFTKASFASAKPGCSEHQTGLAVDINLDNDSFDLTKEAKWLKNNAYKFGFILRYPKGKESITGYKYEPWHYRYIGKKVAKIIYQNNLTLEEYKKT